MKTKNNKRNETSIRVFETLKLLSTKSLSIQEIIQNFEKSDPQNRIYTSEVILKYINTLKVFGFKFEKDKEKYVLINCYPRIDLDLQELSALNTLKETSANFPEETVKQRAINLIEEVEHKLSDEAVDKKRELKKPNIYLSNKFLNERQTISNLEKLITDELKIKLTYKNNRHDTETIDVAPKELTFIKNTALFSVYSQTKSSIIKLKLKDIIDIKQLPQKVSPTIIPKSSTFLLKDRLAKAYILKEHERVLTTNTDGSIVIVNQGEDIKYLLKRLIRYGELCEILSPKELRAEMKNTINAMLDSYKHSMHVK